MGVLNFSLIILSIIGIITTIYLIIKRKSSKPVTCMIGENCNEVLMSKYSKMFFIKNDVLGLIYYLFILIEALYLIFISNNILLITTIITGTAFVFSAFLFYIQAKVIKTYCFYCIFTSIVNLLIFLNILIIYLS